MHRERSHPWYDVAWPALAGITTGAGLIAAYRWTGPLLFVLALACLELTLAPVVWSVLTELGYAGRRVVVRIAPICALAALGVVGLADVVGGWTYLVIAVVLLTSPLLRGWSDGVAGIRARWATPRTRTRREFERIVADSYGTPDEQLPNG